MRVLFANATVIGLTCIVAQALSLLSPPVEPDTKAHEDDPARPSDASNEGRLFHHIRDLLRDAVVPVSVDYHVPKFLTWEHKDEATGKYRDCIYILHKKNMGVRG